MQKPDMFYGAPAHIFGKARELRKTMTRAEIILWEYLRNRQLKGYKFRRQHPLSDFIADFYCHTARLVIEVDGGVHDLEEQKDYDSQRNSEFDRLGIRVIRFTNRQVEKDVETILEEIEKYLP